MGSNLVAPISLATVNGVTGATIWELYDAYTGDMLFNVTNIPTGSTGLGPSGEQLKYVFADANAGAAEAAGASPNWTLGEWNSSKLFFLANGASPTFENTTGTQISGASSGTWLPIPVQGAAATLANGTTITVYPGATLQEDASICNPTSPMNRYDYNVSVPWLNTMGNQTLTTLTNGAVVEGYTGTGPNPDTTNPVTVLATFAGNLLLCRNGTYPTFTNGATTSGVSNINPTINGYTYFAVNLNASRGAIGSVMWWNTIQPPAGNVTVLFAGADATANVFVENYRESNSYVGYNLLTGAQIWGPTPSINAMNPWDYYASPGPGTMDDQVAYGNMYIDGYGGVLYCYSLANGNLLWSFGNGGQGNSTNGGFNIVYGNYPMAITDIGNGIVYIVTCEHTVTDPIYKGAMTYAINATNGDQIWALSDFTGAFNSPPGYAIADGFSTFYNEYDNQVYTLGQGPSATTVSASPKVQTSGDNVIIEGMVTDISAGTQQTVVKTDFPHGVPVASDASMKDWMAYVYQQQVEPTNFTGVQVQLYVLDSNGNYRQIGTTTTDENGMYTLTWTPDIPGNYTVYAAFAGTQGYWPSSAETSFNVMSAPTGTAAPTATPLSAADMYFVPSIIAVIAIIIVGFAILALLAVRKRP